MKSALDLLIFSGEASLQRALSKLDGNGRQLAISELQDFLGLTQEKIEAQTLRILLERARPLLISSVSWNQGVGSSDPVRSSIREYLKGTLKLQDGEISASWIDGLEKLAVNFKENRVKVTVSIDLLEKCKYRCTCCGYLFKDNDLESLVLELPEDLKSLHNTSPIDAFHPIAENAKLARPSVDHVWPVSLYGNNHEENLAIICTACNQGKANFISAANAAPNVGHNLRKYFLPGAIDRDVFFGAVARDGECKVCSALPSERQLTVRPRMEEAVAVSDNLMTVCYDCIDPSHAVGKNAVS
jgi:5-methylcytosine-specific restriction endonuclease McrA